MALATEIMGGGLSAGQAQAINGQGASIAGAGSTQATATAVNVSNAIITGADGSVGVILPAGQVGDNVTLFNNSASTLKVYPPVGAAIAVPGTGLGSANAAFSHLTYKTVTYRCQSSTQWFPTVTA